MSPLRSIFLTLFLFSSSVFGDQSDGAEIPSTNPKLRQLMSSKVADTQEKLDLTPNQVETLQAEGLKAVQKIERLKIQIAASTNPDEKQELQKELLQAKSGITKKLKKDLTPTQLAYRKAMESEDKITKSQVLPEKKNKIGQPRTINPKIELIDLKYEDTANLKTAKLSDKLNLSASELEKVQSANKDALIREAIIKRRIAGAKSQAEVDELNAQLKEIKLMRVEAIRSNLEGEALASFDSLRAEKQGMPSKPQDPSKAHPFVKKSVSTVNGSPKTVFLPWHDGMTEEQIKTHQEDAKMLKAAQR